MNPERRRILAREVVSGETTILSKGSAMKVVDKTRLHPKLQQLIEKELKTRFGRANTESNILFLNEEEDKLYVSQTVPGTNHELYIFSVPMNSEVARSLLMAADGQSNHKLEV